MEKDKNSTHFKKFVEYNTLPSIVDFVGDGFVTKALEILYAYTATADTEKLKRNEFFEFIIKKNTYLNNISHSLIDGYFLNFLQIEFGECCNFQMNGFIFSEHQDLIEMFTLRYVAFLYDCICHMQLNKTVTMLLDPSQIEIRCRKCCNHASKKIINNLKVESRLDCVHWIQATDELKRFISFERQSETEKPFGWKILDAISYLKEEVDVRHTYTKLAIVSLCSAKKRRDGFYFWLNIPHDLFRFLLIFIWKDRFSQIYPLQWPEYLKNKGNVKPKMNPLKLANSSQNPSTLEGFNYQKYCQIKMMEK